MHMPPPVRTRWALIALLLSLVTVVTPNPRVLLQSTPTKFPSALLSPTPPVIVPPATSGSGKLRETLIAAGNFTLGNTSVNVAQYDVATGVWSNVDEIDLYLYGESNGVIWDIAVYNSGVQGIVASKMYFVGAFDTITKTSQVQFCSVGSWDGFLFSKVGEGLCPRGGDPSSVMHIQTTVIGNGGDIFVAGSFESRVWDGSHFVNVYHVARFDSITSSWLPLRGGQLLTGEPETQETLVTSLAWDAANAILYIGGIFSFIDEEPISTGLAMWSKDTGIVSFPGSGLTFSDIRGIPSEPDMSKNGNFSTSNKNEYYSEVLLAFEPITASLFISGSFIKVNGEDCQLVAVWHREKNAWMCLFQNTKHTFLDVSAMHLTTSGQLIVAGKADPQSTWRDIGKYPYAIAVLNIEGYILERTIASDDPAGVTGGGNGTSSPSGSRTGNSSQSSSVAKRWKGERSQMSMHEIMMRTGAMKRRRRLLLPKNSTGPSGAPSLWSPVWTWLPGFQGTDSAVRKINAGSGGRYEGSLFIAGAFTNYPAILLWQRNSSGIGFVRPVNPKYSLQGLVTSIVHVYLPINAAVSDSKTNQARKDYTIFILFSCILVGVILGISFAVSFSSANSGGYSRIDNMLEGGADSETGSIMLSIPLKTLSGGADNLDFRKCFERAMKARHLPTHEILLIINPKEIVLSRIIGEGSFGRVWSGQWRNNAVAVKEFVFAQAAMESLERNNIIEEIVGEAGIMACLRHPKILQLYGCTITMQAIWIVSELCSVGSLRMLLNDRKIELSLIQKLSICLDVADGMLYLHTRSPPIIHRDLKSHNIFITEAPSSNKHYVAKIGDWGSARAIALTGAKSMTNGVGTACWLAPEVINYAHSSKGSDVYAFGIVLWEVYTRQEVHEGLSAAQIIAKVANEGLRPQVPWNCLFGNIMTDCWKQDANERPSFAKIMKALSQMLIKIKPVKEEGREDEDGIGGGSSPGDEYRGRASLVDDIEEEERDTELLAAIGLGQDRVGVDQELE